MRSVRRLEDAAQVVARRIRPVAREFLESGVSAAGASPVSQISYCYVSSAYKDGGEFWVSGYLMQHSGALEPDLDSPIDVLCRAYGTGVSDMPWEEVVPYYQEGDIIRVTKPSPQYDDQPWEAVDGLIGTCESGA